MTGRPPTGPHRRGPRPTDRSVYPRRRGRNLAQPGRRHIEQTGPLDDRGYGTCCGPMPQHRPGVGRHPLDLQQRGDGSDVVGARQGERAPAVSGREQPGATPGRNPTAPGQSQQSGPPDQQGTRVNGDTEMTANRRGDLFGAGQHLGAGEVGPPVGQAGQVGQPAAPPPGRRVAHLDHCPLGQKCSALNRQSSTARSGASTPTA